MMGTVSITMLPAHDGDCLFVEAFDFRLLIDGGRSLTGKKALPEFLATLPERVGKPAIDLMVLTHVDADHIAGLLTFLANRAGGLMIGEVWFNGLDHHKTAAGIFVPPRTQEIGTSGKLPSGTLNVTQALKFHEFVQALSIPWNERAKGEVLMVLQYGSLPRLTLTPGLDLVLLGPPKQKLADFYPEWDAAVRKLNKPPTLEKRPKFIPTVENLHLLAKLHDEPDRTKPNGASIAFILEAGEGDKKRRVLFAADAHPDDILSGLERYTNDGRIFFDAIKVSHHGSARNSTSSLVDKLTSPCWLVSTDGSRHEHPDTEALARIVLTPGDEKTLVFNYRSKHNKSWDDKDLRSTFRYRTCYGDGKAPVTIVV